MNNFLWLSHCIRHFAYKIPLIKWWQQYCQMDSIVSPIHHLGIWGWDHFMTISHHKSWKSHSCHIPQEGYTLPLCIISHRSAYPLRGATSLWLVSSCQMSQVRKPCEIRGNVFPRGRSHVNSWSWDSTQTWWTRRTDYGCVLLQRSGQRWGLMEMIQDTVGGKAYYTSRGLATKKFQEKETIIWFILLEMKFCFSYWYCS